ncbi:MAG: acyl-CoA dehydrogenase, partial [Actinobacteria bacterium]|nr:acyl-CoA dehydrogenase [Actinomycetota bacterium]
MSTAPDLQTAAAVINTARAMVDTAIQTLIAKGGPDANQTLAYDIAHVAAAIETSRGLLEYGAKGTVEGNITCAFTADMVHDFISRLIGREKLWGVDPSGLSSAHDFVQTYREPAFLASLADQQGPRHLGDEFEMVQDTFRSFGAKVIAPQAEHVHRHNGDVPEDVIAGLAEIGAFGLSVPVEYDGFSEGGEGEYMASVIATEELTRASLGIGGSLITRPEILTRAL